MRYPTVTLYIENSPEVVVRANADSTSPYIWVRFGGSLTLTISKDQAETLIADLQESVANYLE